MWNAVRPVIDDGKRLCTRTWWMPTKVKSHIMITKSIPFTLRHAKHDSLSWYHFPSLNACKCRSSVDVSEKYSIADAKLPFHVHYFICQFLSRRSCA